MVETMNEVGKPRTTVVRTRKLVRGKKKLVPKIGTDGQPETKIVHSSVWRVTREALDGSFGKDRKRKLVVGFVAPDLLALRPAGTRQQITIPLTEVYRMAIHRKANIAHMAKLREKKAKKQALRERRALDRAERRFKRKCT
jgi:hypothetical protein